VVYAFHANTSTIDAISDANGQVLWSWPLPTNDSTPTENMVVTDNLLFLSTLQNVYAIDLATHQAVWTYPSHGILVLSNNLVLYIFQRDFLQNSKLTAIKLT